MFNTVVTFGVFGNTLGLFEITLGLSGITAALSQIRCKDKTIYFGVVPKAVQSGSKWLKRV